ncbi:class I adenylate-forming enzyme family protein [Actinomadura rupiterrae]|uniref:class I adenylate-forming enzyme family protein n=1 Tax=Actinomadura rupiterrae TaxID=559627 RepID=UPI0020A52DAB|nr:AMP-binding protein [Actinomadura rupiterrae]MCP2342308.1 acyl-CoA synthetase (AMP-forming)/AMP-acid ligase II [Actinomadura rupiterrae]
MLLADLAHRGATLWPERTAITGNGHHRTYRELHERAEAWRRLLAGSGVRAGDRIALLSVNVPDVLEAAFGASLIGAAVVPLNVRLSAEEIRFQVRDAGARHAVVHPALEPLARSAGLHALTCWTIGPETETALSRAPASDLPRPDPDAPVMQLYTSGTTGRPKGCLLSNRAWVVASSNVVQALGLTGDDRLLGALPLFHVAGYGAALAQLAVGGTVVLPPGAAPEQVWPVIAEHGVTVAIFPTGTGRALRHEAAAPATLRLLFGIAATERPRTLEALRELGIDYRGIYGSTEAGNFVSISTLADELARPGTVGRPLPPFDISVDAPPGEVGELLVRGATLMSGYAGLPEATAEALRGGWLHTGDLLRLDVDGYLYFVDRAKDMVKSGGENVYSAEVERVLAGHPAVLDVAVVGVPDRRWGEAVKALVVARGELTPAELDAHCRGRLGGFKRPRWYELVEAIPRNHSGKILKRELRAAHDPAKAVRISEDDRISGDGAKPAGGQGGGGSVPA